MLKVRKNQSPPLEGPCALTQCMSVLAGRWSANVIWHLRAGPRRFNELRHDIPPISAKILSARLRELEGRGVLTRHVLQTSPPSVEYQLTDLGAQLVPALDAIVAVGHELKKRKVQGKAVTPPPANSAEFPPVGSQNGTGFGFLQQPIFGAAEPRR